MEGVVRNSILVVIIIQAMVFGSSHAFAGPKPKCYVRMATLIEDNHLSSPSSANISKALLMCIFWEESTFTNTREKGGPAVGFGQVNSPFLSAFHGVLTKFAAPTGPVKTPIVFTAAAALADDAFSVQIASAVTNFTLA